MPALMNNGVITAICDFVVAVSGAPVIRGQVDQVALATPHFTVQLIDAAARGFSSYTLDLDASEVSIYEVVTARYQIDAYGDGAGGVLPRIKMEAESPTTAGLALEAAGVSWVRMGAIRDNTGRFLSGNLPRHTVTITVEYLQSAVVSTSCEEAASIDVNITGTGATTASLTPAFSIPES